MKAIDVEQINPLGNSLMTESTRQSGDNGDADDYFNFCAVIAKMEEIVIRKYQKALSKKLGSIMNGGGGNGGYTGSTTGMRATTGFQAGSNQSIQTINVGNGPTFLGSLTIGFRSYNNSSGYSDGKTRYGVEIEMWYKDNNSGYKYLNWVQNISYTYCNDKQEVTKWFNDPEKNDDPPGKWRPYYYTEKEYFRASRVPRGFSEYFYDAPARQIFTGFSQNFEAEVSLVGRDKNGVFAPLITLKYGFSVDRSGHFSPQYWYVSTPSFALQMMINSLNNNH